MRALHELDRDIALTLIDRLQSQEVPIRRGAAWALSKLIDEKLVPDNRAANALIKQGQADNLVVISVAYRFLIRLGDTKLETAEVAVDLFVRKAKLAKPRSGGITGAAIAGWGEEHLKGPPKLGSRSTRNSPCDCVPRRVP